MKAVRVHEFGGPEVLHYEDETVPSPGPGQILVKVAGAGLNWADQVRREGRYPGVNPPFTMGTEASGTIEALGPGVSEYKVGDKIIGRGSGCQAEYVTLDLDEVFHAPSNIDLVQAGGIPVIFQTAYFMLKDRAHMAKGETVLVHAGASGVGTAAIQLSKLWGARVIATSSAEDKLKIASSLGADITVNYLTQDFAEEVNKATNGVGADVILDGNGGTTFEKGITCLAPYGRLVIYGTNEGNGGNVNHRDLYTTNRTVIGFSRGRTPKGYLDIRGAMAEIISLIEEGALKLVVDRIMPMSGIIESHHHLSSRGSRGKSILTPD